MSWGRVAMSRVHRIRVPNSSAFCPCGRVLMVRIFASGAFLKFGGFRNTQSPRTTTTDTSTKSYVYDKFY